MVGLSATSRTLHNSQFRSLNQPCNSWRLELDIGIDAKTTISWPHSQHRHIDQPVLASHQFLDSPLCHNSAGFAASHSNCFKRSSASRTSNTKTNFCSVAFATNSIAHFANIFVVPFWKSQVNKWVVYWDQCACSKKWFTINWISENSIVNTCKILTWRIDFLAASLPCIPVLMELFLFFGLAMSNTMTRFLSSNRSLWNFLLDSLSTNIVRKWSTQFLDSNREDSENIVLS